MNCSLLVLDGDWQRCQGDLAFDPDRFSNLTNLTSSMQSTCSLALQVSVTQLRSYCLLPSVPLCLCVCVCMCVWVCVCL